MMRRSVGEEMVFQDAVVFIKTLSTHETIAGGGDGDLVGFAFGLGFVEGSKRFLEGGREVVGGGLVEPGVAAAVHALLGGFADEAWFEFERGFVDELEELGDGGLARGDAGCSV